MLIMRTGAADMFFSLIRASVPGRDATRSQTFTFHPSSRESHSENAESCVNADYSLPLAG